MEMTHKLVIVWNVTKEFAKLNYRFSFFLAGKLYNE